MGRSRGGMDWPEQSILTGIFCVAEVAREQISGKACQGSAGDIVGQRVMQIFD